jgi:hypothetical protein
MTRALPALLLAAIVAACAWLYEPEPPCPTCDALNSYADAYSHPSSGATCSCGSAVQQKAR